MLTGKLRLREQKRWFRRSVYVLQVEYKYLEADVLGYFTSHFVTAWRDWEPHDGIFLRE